MIIYNKQQRKDAIKRIEELVNAVDVFDKQVEEAKCKQQNNNVEVMNIDTFIAGSLPAYRELNELERIIWRSIHEEL